MQVTPSGILSSFRVIIRLVDSLMIRSTGRNTVYSPRRYRTISEVERRTSVQVARIERSLDLLPA
jgi:hypothetical protein